MRIPAFCICENKDADQFRGNREADQRLERQPAGTGYPLIGDSSRKFPFLVSFVPPLLQNHLVLPKYSPMWLARVIHPCNFSLPTSSRKSTLSQARQNLQPTPSPMHNGFDLDFPRNQRFPATTAPLATYTLVWSTIPTRQPTPESRHSREKASQNRVRKVSK